MHLLASAKRARKPSAFAPAVGVKQSPPAPPPTTSTKSSKSQSQLQPLQPQKPLSKSPLKSGIVHFTSGGLAAGLVRASLQPLDTCKTRLQASRNTTQSLRHILFPVGSSGFQGLYRGVIPGVVGIVPAAAVYMLTFQTLKSKLGERFPKRKNDLVVAFSAGLADVAASLIRVPCEVLKQRLQIGIYNNISHALKTVISKRQIPRLYTGLSAQLSRDVPYAAAEFLVYENLKSSIYTFRNQSKQQNDDDNVKDEQLGKVDGLLIGALAGAFAAIISNPADVVKTRLMTQIKSQGTANATGIQVTVQPYKGVRDAFQRIAKEEGMKTFTKGIAPRIAAKALQSALFFAAYDGLRRAVSKALHVDPYASTRPAH